jgi:hypothetical protein
MISTLLVSALISMRSKVITLGLEQVVGPSGMRGTGSRVIARTAPVDPRVTITVCEQSDFLLPILKNMDRFVSFHNRKRDGR